MRGALGTTKVLTSPRASPPPGGARPTEVEKYFLRPEAPQQMARPVLRRGMSAATSEPRDLVFAEPVRAAPTATKQHAALTKLGMPIFGRRRGRRLQQPTPSGCYRGMLI